jgi:hypothetical protein
VPWARSVGGALARTRVGLTIVGMLVSTAGAQAPATSVPYTVQVAALSDAEAAIDLSGDLLRDGFPAYVVRAEGAVGSVFRVRVAAFGDRVSADRYADELSARRGGAPRPALAEAIPAGILPLAPIRLFRVEGDARAVVLDWGAAGVVLRSGPQDGPARYRGEDGRTFEAWWARPTGEGGREEVARLPLDDAAAAEDEPAVRDALFRQRLRLVADQAGLDATGLEQEAVRGAPGDRHLIVWRSVGATSSVLGVVRSAASPASRVAGDWLGGVPPEPPSVLLVVREGPETDTPVAAVDGDVAEPEGEAADDPPSDAPAAEGSGVLVVEGEGWRARRDGTWTVLAAEGATWRALVGAPRRGMDGLLVLEVEGGRELVRLAPR